ncbi:TCR/Tet family MFS transporter [Arenimonas sp. GDDSR-1]|uniref:TCR/Tet family MFS transporter n=1 Tax=Arenimonas sp. GDDSR-1 TaxID=2950125 RepID=UPI00261F16CA|nr:TCR/Tet family MFS transporter [Arenimonas sp. GDDSR-1]
MTATQPARRAALIFIFFTVLIDILAFGLIIPVLPHLIKTIGNYDFGQAAMMSGWFSVAFSFIQFVFAPLLGALSDRYGRRRVILISCFGLAVDFTFMALASSIPMFFIGRVISAMTSASFSTANAYLADVTPPEKRAGAFGLLGAAFGIGFVIGPALGGLLGGIDLRLPFWVASGLAALNFCYGLFVLPESLPPEKRSPRFDLKRANPIGALLLLKHYKGVLGLLAVVFLGQLAHYVFPSVFVLYADYRYQWGEQQVGYVLGLVGICNVLVQAFLIRRLVPKIGERRALMLGLLFGLLGFAWQGMAATGLLSLLAIPLLALWGLAGPSIQAVITKQVHADEQGRLQGAIASMNSLAGIIAPFLFTHVFALFISDHAPVVLPGAPYLLASLFLLTALLLAYHLTKWMRPSRTAGDTAPI